MLACIAHSPALWTTTGSTGLRANRAGKALPGGQHRTWVGASTPERRTLVSRHIHVTRADEDTRTLWAHGESNL